MLWLCYMHAFIALHPSVELGLHGLGCSKATCRSGNPIEYEGLSTYASLSVQDWMFSVMLGTYQEPIVDKDSTSTTQT